MKRSRATVKLGTKFRYTYADGNPLWEVIQARGAGTWICKVVESPDYNGMQKCFSTEEIQRSIGIANFWKKTADESENFYAALLPGSIVHYNSGFGNFVRCAVTHDHQLLPIALVGNWQPHDLPRRYLNGDIDLGYNAKQIVEKKHIHPHASNLWEASKDLQQRFKDPASFEPISLNVPDMSPEQEKMANKFRHIDSVRVILNQENANPDIVIEQIEKVVSAYRNI